MDASINMAFRLQASSLRRAMQYGMKLKNGMDNFRPEENNVAVILIIIAL